MCGISEIAMGIGAAASVASAAGGIASGSKAGSSASSANDIASQEWNDYLTNFMPVEQAAIKTATTPARQDPAFLAQMGGINRNYASSGANIKRMMGGMYPGGAGVAYGAQAANERNRTRDIAKSEADWNNQKWQQQYALMGIGRGVATNAQQGYNQLANMYGQQSGQAFQGAGQGLGNLYQAYVLQNYLNKGSTVKQPATDFSTIEQPMTFGSEYNL